MRISYRKSLILLLITSLLLIIYIGELTAKNNKIVNDKPKMKYEQKLQSLITIENHQKKELSPKKRS